MKAKEIHAMSDKDLDKQLKDGRAELFNLRFQMATSQLDNTARVCAVKKDIARVQTEMRMRELAAEMGVNTRTVLKAMDDLQDLEVIESRRGMGFMLHPDAAAKVTDARRREFYEVTLPALLEEMRRLGISKEDLVSRIK